MPSVRTLLRRPADTSARSLSLDDIGRQLEVLQFGAQQYLLAQGRVGSYRNEEVRVGGESQAVTTSGAVFAVVGRRIDLFSQVRFAWRRFGAGPRPMASDLFTDAAIAPLNDCAELLSWMELDQAIAGNSFVVRDGDRLVRLIPWWVTVVVGSQSQPDSPETAWDARPIGFVYQPPGGTPEPFLAGEVAHYFNRPDPDARYRGMSYLRPVLRNAANTEGYERYLSQFWANAATPNTWLKFPESKTQAEVAAFADLFEERHAGLGNAFKTAYVGGGADPQVIGSSLKDLDAAEVTAGEYAQICNAGGVPVVVAGIVPGLETASTYANYASALRAFADLTVRPCWLKATAALSKLLPAPRGAELHADPSGIAALQEDAKDDAEVMQTQANTMRTLGDAGYTPDSVMLAVTTGDMTKLVHSGYFSVQLQAPGGGEGGESAPTDEERAAAQALTLQRLYLPLNSDQPVINVAEARKIATAAGGIPLTGPPPVKSAPAPSQIQPPAPFELGPADDGEESGSEQVE